MPLPDLDDRLRRRLARRFGDSARAWLDALPPVLNELGERWGLEFGNLIQRGSFSAVIRCQTRAARAAVLKTSPDRERIVDEAAALGCWSTPHVPSVLALDEGAGTLLIEAVEPGTALDESGALADDVAAIARRAEQLAPSIGVDAGRLLDWCVAFAGMASVDVFESPLATEDRLRAVLELAGRTPA